MLDPNLNPYKDAVELTPWQWMLKYNKYKMIFTFLFTSIFIFLPWIGQWYIASNVVRWIVTLVGLLINLGSTFLLPYLEYRHSVRDYKQWNKNNKQNWYK